MHGKRSLIRGAPTRPGVYLFRDRHDQVLYVGRARDLRARLRSYFQSERQRPSVEAALLALERIEWRVLGSELEAALEELRLIRELQPPANSRSRRNEHGRLPATPRRRVRRHQDPDRARPDRQPPASRARRPRARLCTRRGARRLLQGGPLPRLRARLADLTESLRYEEAARLRDRIEALENVLERLAPARAPPRARACLIAPALTPGWRKAFFVGRRRSAPSARSRPGPGARLEIDAGLALAAPPPELEETLTAAQAEDLMLLHGFIRRPPPELAVLPLDAERIAEHLSRRRLPRAA